MNKNLIFINKIPDKFKVYEDYIKEVLDDFYNAMHLCGKIKIKFGDCEDNEYEKTSCLVRNISVAKHEMVISDDELNSINYDGGEDFCLSVYHEFLHINDYNNLMQTKLFKFNLCSAHQKDFDGLSIN